MQNSQKVAGFSPYNYVMGNPIRLIDPTGMYPEGSDPNEGYVTNNKNATTLIIFGKKTMSDKKASGFQASYNTAKKNKNVDVFIATDLKQLNSELDKVGKIYDNILFADHGTYPLGGVGDGNDAAQLIGNFPYGVESTNQYAKLSDNLSENGNIIFGGCFTGSCKFGGDNFIENVANATNRNVYGNQGESYYGSRLFDYPLGGAWDGHEKDYFDVANIGAGKWLRATPLNGSVMINNIMLTSSGKIRHTNFISGNKIKGRRK